MKVAGIESADIQEPNVLVGLLIGGMFPYFFSSRLFKAVTASAFAMIEEVRRQIREIPGIMEDKAKPDYARCVTIATDGAIRVVQDGEGLAPVALTREQPVANLVSRLRVAAAFCD